VRYLATVFFSLLFLPYTDERFLSYNFNVFDIVFSPLPWKLGSLERGVLFYESLPAYWILFLAKIIVALIFFEQILWNNLKFRDSNFNLAVFLLLTVQTMSILDGPRQTTMLLGFLLMGFSKVSLRKC
jgi:hypothetical protein